MLDASALEPVPLSLLASSVLMGQVPLILSPAFISEDKNNNVSKDEKVENSNSESSKEVKTETKIN